MADKLNGIIISEILADNAGGSAIDTDNDGNTNKSDEFIELQNTTGSTISLDGYELWSETNGLLYSFGPGDTIAPGDTATIVGNYSGTVPAGYYDGGVSEGTNWIPDGEGQKYDSIFLVDTATGDYIVLSYGRPPQTPTLPSGFPGTTLIGAGESINSSAPNGTAFSRDQNGDMQEGTPTPGEPGVPCYAPGTLIDTPDGPRAVEALQPGDLVLTRDHGAMPIRWTHQGVQRLEQVSDNARPVLIRAGAFGAGCPSCDMVVSPQHRILIGQDGQMQGLDSGPVLVPAKALTDLPRIRHMKGRRAITWVHFALDCHAVVMANGCASESLLLGPVVLRGLSFAGRRNLDRIFGKAATPDGALNGPPARPFLRVGEARRMLKAAARDMREAA